MLALIAAAITTYAQPSHSIERLTESQLRAYAAISNIAKATCGPQATNGQIVSVGAKTGATLNIDKIRQILGSAGVSLAGEMSSSRWRGPLQRDIGSALASRTECIEKSFEAMVVRLPLTDAATGKDIPRPSSGAHAYKLTMNASRNEATPSAASENTSTGGQQIAANAPATNIQIGGPTGNGSNINQYNYLTPTTPDQKQQAREALLTDLGELARYPERGLVEPGPSIIQQHFLYKAPRALYLLLSKYNHATIESIQNGAQLNGFEAAYYAFESRAPLFEQAALARIGAKTPQHSPYAWRIIYEYCINRSGGKSQKEIVGIIGDMNYGITPEQAETIYQDIRVDPDIGPGLNAEVGAVDQFTKLTSALLAEYRGG